MKSHLFYRLFIIGVFFVTVAHLHGCTNNEGEKISKNGASVGENDVETTDKDVLNDANLPDENPLPDSNLPTTDEEGSINVDPLKVNSLEDSVDPPTGTVTLRSALKNAPSGATISFDKSLNGGIIKLSIVGEEHTILKGEVMGMRTEPSGPISYLEGYFERDYGKSALYANKEVVIDASALPEGITIAWTGGEEIYARVLAVYGDLTMNNVTITGGSSVAEDIVADEIDDQPWTLARGGGVAVWGKARLVRCTLYDNHCAGDFESSRDRGAFGGGLYANIVELKNCIVSGNTVVGAGAAGGGVYSVGGADSVHEMSTIVQSAITGNRISGLFTYGGGLYSDGGGIGNQKTLKLTNSTIARNLVEIAPNMPPFLLSIGYWRGGGVYMSNGSLEIQSCTIVENEVHGVPRVDTLEKSNLAGGIAATVGNAHAVEDMTIGHSIVTGNKVYELDMAGFTVASYEHDIFTGTVLNFESRGYNRFGVIDFSQILVPVGEWRWRSLSRKHYPKVSDEDGIAVTDVLDTANVTTSDTIFSTGIDAGGPSVLHYTPKGDAVDAIPPSSYYVESIYADYWISDSATNDFLEILLSRIEKQYNLSRFC